MTKKIVTIGGGHGQAAMLEALLRVACDVTAVVSVADDGGCSGRLRERFGMPPPGDLRRCLSALARDRELAARFEERFEDEDDVRRCAGNLALFEAYMTQEDLQAAVDWAGRLLQCVGHVVAVAVTPAELKVFDSDAGLLEGESTIGERGAKPVVVGVHGPTHASPRAISAVREADIILLGPGSFITSTLAAVITGDLASAVVASGALKLLVENLGEERGQMTGKSRADHLRLLRDHLCIATGERDIPITVLRDGAFGSTTEDGTNVLSAPLSAEGTGVHDPTAVAEALCRHFGLVERAPRSEFSRHLAAKVELEEHIARARARARM